MSNSNLHQINYADAEKWAASILGITLEDFRKMDPQDAAKEVTTVRLSRLPASPLPDSVHIDPNFYGYGQG